MSLKIRYLYTCFLGLILSPSKDQQDFGATRWLLFRSGSYLTLKKTSKIDPMNFDVKVGISSTEHKAGWRWLACTSQDSVQISSKTCQLTFSSNWKSSVQCSQRTFFTRGWSPVQLSTKRYLEMTRMTPKLTYIYPTICGSRVWFWSNTWRPARVHLWHLK